MTKQEAKKLMKNGEKLTHQYFSDDEWVKTDKSGSIYILEDGVECSEQEFWQWRTADYWLTGWEIYKKATQSELEAKALIAGDLLQEGEVTRLECFRVEMDAALGENTGDLQFKKNTDFLDKTM